MKKQDAITVKEILFYVFAVIFLTLHAQISGIPFLPLFLFFILAAYLKIQTIKLKDKNYNFLCLGFLFLLGVSSAQLLREYSQFSAYYVPVAAIAMLVSLLYRDLELSFLFSVSLSLFVGMIYGADIYLSMVLIIGSFLASLLVWQARRRSTIISAGFYVGLVQSLCILTFFHQSGMPLSAILKFAGSPFMSGLISSFLVAGLLPFFEFVFGVYTNISLLELADFNHPLLKRLVLEAPGTYHHSLMVGNLAEMAAEVVGANALLARVGAYYHDIGKIEKPDYFSENQDRYSSKHENLSASMSKLIIMDHVKTGVELAKKNSLNKAIIDFITQHHGTSLAYYFYRKALEEKEEKDNVKEDVFRYPGPKPQSRETAIVLLADSVEAACRSLDEPTPERISDIVHKIINNKFIDGQLDSCDITLSDLEKIASTFIHILGAFYHSRVDYPEQSKGEPK